MPSIFPFSRRRFYAVSPPGHGGTGCVPSAVSPPGNGQGGTGSEPSAVSPPGHGHGGTGSVPSAVSPPGHGGTGCVPSTLNVGFGWLKRCEIIENPASEINASRVRQQSFREIMVPPLLLNSGPPSPVPTIETQTLVNRQWAGSFYRVAMIPRLRGRMGLKLRELGKLWAAGRTSPICERLRIGAAALQICYIPCALGRA
jgi:hypothetical protein